MQSANLSGPFRGCLYYALLGLPQATGLAGGYDCGSASLQGKALSYMLKAETNKTGGILICVSF